MGFINMICETNKEFRNVDSRLSKLRVQKIGKTYSLPSLELKKAIPQPINTANEKNRIFKIADTNRRT